MEEGQLFLYVSIAVIISLNCLNLLGVFSGNSHSTINLDSSKSTSSYGSIFASTISTAKTIPNVEGQSCSTYWGYDEDTVCGFGYTCKSGKCVEDWSHPEKLVRDATDQGPCDCSSAISAVHQFDDRFMAFQNHYSNNNNLKLAKVDLTSIGYARDCSVTNNFQSCNGANFQQTMHFLDSSELPSEYDEPFNATRRKCRTKYSKKRKVPKFPVNEVCYSNAEDLVKDLHRYGPIAQDILVYEELFNYPNMNPKEMHKEFKILSDSVEIFGSKYEYQSIVREGYTSVLIDGHAQNYFIIKFPWGPRFGFDGHVYIEQAFFLKRYALKCDTDYVYDWRRKAHKLATIDSSELKFPVMEMTSSMILSDPQTETDRLVRTELYDIRLNRPVQEADLVTNPNILILDSKTKLGAADEINSGNMPKIGLIIRAVENHLNNNLQKYNFKEEVKFKYRVVKVLYANMAVVSGRKYNLLVGLRRIHKSKGSENDFSFDDPTKNSRLGFEQSEILYRISIWLPLKSSDTSAFYKQTETIYGNFLYMDAEKYIIVQEKFVAKGVVGGPDPPPRPGDGIFAAIMEYITSLLGAFWPESALGQIITGLLTGLTLLQVYLNWAFLTDPERVFEWIVKEFQKIWKMISPILKSLGIMQ